MDDKKCCGTCKYHQHESLDGDWVCINPESELCGWTEYDDTCEEWKGRDECPD